MQTFLPYRDFASCAKCLDNKRLFKQVVEAKQIISCLEGTGSLRWRNHPAVKMWAENVDALKGYFNACLLEWLFRGGNSSYGFLDKDYRVVWQDDVEMPLWFEEERVFAGYRSNLLRKKREWYGKFGWKEEDNLEYFWPTKGTAICG